ncbi:flagellar biosynthesis protein FlhF [Pedomonas mirosovicensis]|uniref:flagellar biosynthesis protein FlhF n=1 Tax=Pedomonas mirosovicensis TaxID=2908641 RepID=UPI002169788E|nr:hypothetical protein [Pedomonas mirosovicensis]MCH8685892.1 hypothetical protein [Pedomonas mirosovicensis]
MRLKIYTGKTIAQAKDKVRAELGDDAVIVNIDHDKRTGLVRITAAIENRPDPEPIEAPEPVSTRPFQRFDAGHLAAVLRYHGFPSPLSTRLQTSAAARQDSDMVDALALAIDDLVKVQPIDIASNRPILLLGAPGQGKTLAAVRLAVEARSLDRPARVITLDGKAAGAMEQLRAFCGPAEVDMACADDAAHLERLLTPLYEGFTVIDSMGINPYALSDIELLAYAVKRSGAEPIWVMAAGADSLEAAEMAEIFASLGVRRMIVTRLDASRRLAATLTAPIRSRLALAGFSASPYLADLIQPASPMTLAEFLLDKPDPTHIARIVQEKAAS